MVARKGELGKKWLSYQFAHATPDALNLVAAPPPVARRMPGDDRRPDRRAPRSATASR